MYCFDFDFPTRILFGAGRLNDLHTETMPGKKAIIVTSSGSSVWRYGYLERLERELRQVDISYVIFPGIRSNPTRKSVMDGAKMARDNECDFVIALGGGSVMDCAKCIALMAVNEGDIWDYSLSKTGGKKEPQNPCLPIICITTSAGTGSEIDVAAVISDDMANEKTALFHPSMFPTLSIVDCELMMSVPKRYTAYQGMDAFFHAAETMINVKKHPMAEMFALKTIEYIAKYLPRAVFYGQDKEARGYVALANTFAGYYMLCTSGHALEHTMGSYHSDLIHGAGLIMIAHAYYDFFAERKAAEDAMIKMAKAMGYDYAASGKDFISALDNLIETVECSDLKMSEVGITKKELLNYPEKLHEIIGGDITADPIILTDNDYLEIYMNSYK